MDFDLSDSEVLERMNLLNALAKRANGTVITPDNFQQSLQDVGLKFGSPEVDRVLLQCRIQDDGQVNFSSFQDDVRMRVHARERSSNNVSAGYSNLRENVSGKGLQFQQALENTLMEGKRTVNIPEELANLPQSDKVRRLAKEIHTLFREFDSGSMRLDVFREHLRALGIDETPEAQRLLRQTPLSFSQFFRALLSDNSLNDARQPAVEPNATTPQSHRGRRLGPRSTERNRNVITWKREPTAPGMDNTQQDSPLSERGAPDGSTSGHGPYNNRHTRETGAKSIIYRQSEGKSGTQPDVDLYHQRSLKSDRGLPEESGAGAILRGQDEDIPERFESVTQSVARMGLGGNYAASRPLTSAGYYTTDGGLVREQVYSSIRQLDQGVITAREFRTKLRKLGIDVPLGVNKLLIDYEANGGVDFARFVRAFEDYFASHTHHSQNSRPVTASPHLVKYSDEAFQDHTPSKKLHAQHGALIRGHGDILSWSNVKDETLRKEQDEAMRMSGLRPNFKPRRDLYELSGGVRLGSNDIISWQTNDARTGQHTPQRGRGAAVAARRDAGNIIAWAGGHFSSNDAAAPSTDHQTIRAGVAGDPSYSGGRGRGGDIMPNGVQVGRGRARVHTPLAEKDKYTAGVRPYGTEELPETVQQPNGEIFTNHYEPPADMSNYTQYEMNEDEYAPPPGMVTTPQFQQYSS